MRQPFIHTWRSFRSFAVRNVCISGQRSPFTDALIPLFVFGLLLGPAAQTGAAGDLPDWLDVIHTNRDRLALVESDESATGTFTSAVGPALGLKDVAGTIGAKGLSARLNKELLVQEITQSAQRLVAALVVWDMATAVTHSLEPRPEEALVFPSLPPARQEWLERNGPFPSFTQLLQFSAARTNGRPVAASTGSATAAILAGRSAMEAGQVAMEEWLRLKSWKDRVRRLRGQTRLCGTWHWVIHNHQQHHQEQKLSLQFPPPEKPGPGVAGLAETIVLGDVVYLRWEFEGKTQEDSLLFSKESQRLEGTFINSQGGWGSISGKRAAACAP